MSTSARRLLPPWLSRLRVPRGLPAIRGRLNGAGAAGPRRILVTVGVAGAVAAALTALTFHHSPPDPVSRPGRLPAADPLPGGLNTNPYQDALTVRSNQEAAARQRQAGESFTPQIAPSQSYAERPGKKRALLTSPPPPPPAPAKAAPAAPASIATHDAAPPATAIRVASEQGNQSQARTGSQEADPYKAAIARMMGGWGRARRARTSSCRPARPKRRRTAGPAAARAAPGRGAGTPPRRRLRPPRPARGAGDGRAC